MFTSITKRCFSSSIPFSGVLPKSVKTIKEIQDNFSWSFIPKYYNIAFSTCDRHAIKTPNKTAIIYAQDNKQDIILSYKQLQIQSNKLSNALEYIHKLKKGDKIGILLPQRIETAISHIATYRSGYITIPLFGLFGPDALLYRLSTSNAKVVITDISGLDKILSIKHQLPELQSIIVVQDDSTSIHSKLPPNCYYFHNLIENSNPKNIILHNTLANDPAIIIFTSGTTGDPKGALHAHRVLLGHLPGIEIPHNLLPHGINEGKPLTFYTPADWAWIGGLIDVLLPSLHYGIPVLAHRDNKFDPLRIAKLMEKYNVTNTFMPPTALKLMRQVNIGKYNHMLSIGSGGESLGSELLQWGRDTYNTTINEFYGQTEANLLIGNCGILTDVKEGSMGFAIPGRHIEIVDNNGNILENGQVGNIVAKKGDPVMFLGYYNNEKATKDKFINNIWMKTGDTGKRDDDGFYYFCGRDDDVINSAGYRIGPSEVEDCILKHPSIVMCAAVGSPDPIRNEIVKCFCVLKENIEPSDNLKKEIQKFVKEKLAAHEYPRKIEFVSSLPMTTTGKIQRKILREQEYKKIDKK